MAAGENGVDPCCSDVKCIMGNLIPEKSAEMNMIKVNMETVCLVGVYLTVRSITLTTVKMADVLSLPPTVQSCFTPEP